MGLKANTELANTENEALMWDCAEKPTGSGSQSASKTGPGLGSGDRGSGATLFRLRRAGISLCSGRRLESVV